MDQCPVTPRQFRYFVAVAESGSVAAASRLLSIAQSALTRRLLELEAEIGGPLFVRSPCRRHLLKAGEAPTNRFNGQQPGVWRRRTLP